MSGVSEKHTRDPLIERVYVAPTPIVIQTLKTELRSNWAATTDLHHWPTSRVLCRVLCDMNHSRARRPGGGGGGGKLVAEPPVKWVKVRHMSVYI